MSKYQQYIRAVLMVEITTLVWIYNSSWKAKHKRRIKYIWGKSRNHFLHKILEYATYGYSCSISP